MAESTAKALNELVRCNMHGMERGDRENLLQFALDYFNDESNNTVESEDEEDEFDVNFIDAPEFQEIFKDDDCFNTNSTSNRSTNDFEDEDNEEDDIDNDNKLTPEILVNEAKNILDSVYSVVSNDADSELERIESFDCGCVGYKKGRCIKQFDKEYIQNLRMNINALTNGEKEMFVMGKISCTINMSKMTERTKKVQTERQRYRTTFLIEKKVVCRKAFRFMHCIGNDRLNHIIHAYCDGNIGPIEKRSGGRVESSRVLTFDDIKRIVNFISTFAETHAVILPGRVPGFKRDDLRLLPSNETKASVWRYYSTAMAVAGYRATKLTNFKNIWNRLLPHIVRTKPMSDLCDMCQKNNAAVYKSANLPDIVKQAKLKKQFEHLELVSKERSLYRDMVSQCKKSVENLTLGSNTQCSRNITAHYSFDYAQQVHYPSNPLQPGPIYFLVPRKCGIFGVTCEGIPSQVNYLIDEGMCTGKGSNAVISYLHHFFNTFGLGEQHAELHCDNCSGQNKNKFMIWYLMWRTLHNFHFSITLNFMITGHTKFAPDWCFGLLKQNFKRTEVSSLADMVKCVEKSSVTGVNIPQLVGDEQGNVFVNVHNWQDFLAPYFNQLKGIKKLHHMRFDSNHPGIVFCKNVCDEEEQAINLLKHASVFPPPTLPEVQKPPGLDLKRQWYLFNKIREFCSEESRDIVCPLPVDQQNISLTSEDESETELPPVKRNKGQKRKLEE